MSTDGLMPVPDDLEFGQTIRGFVGGQQVFARYTLQEILGRGGMGLVWLAQDEHLQESVALKFLPELVRLDAISLEELKRETRRSRKLAHSNIVKVYDFASDATSAAISMEYVSGATLSGIRATRQQLCFEIDEIRDCTRQLLNALIYAHEDAKVVHRDLKPANIMVDHTGKVKVTDFGIASSISESVSRVTIQRGASGTLLYMSPQQAMGRSPAVSDDIYSLGATIYELITSKPPFTRGDVLAQLREVVPVSMAERRAELGIEGVAIPAEWEEVIAACLAKEPTGRPQSADEIKDRLELWEKATSRPRPTQKEVALPVPEHAPAPPPVEVVKEKPATAKQPASNPVETTRSEAEERTTKNQQGCLKAVGLFLVMAVIFGVMMWLYGSGDLASRTMNFENLKKAAEGGDVKSQDMLGDLYSGKSLMDTDNAINSSFYNYYSYNNLPPNFGNVPNDSTQATYWYQKAAAQGDVGAKLRLQQLGVNPAQ